MEITNRKSSQKDVTISIRKQHGDNSEREIKSEDLNLFVLGKSDIKRITKKKDSVRGGSKDIEFTVYKSSNFGTISNRFFESFTLYVDNHFPSLLAYLSNSLRSSDIPLLSKTYMSISFFSGFIAFFGTLLAAFIIGSALGSSVVLSVVRSIGIAVLVSISTFCIVFFYPSLIISERRKAIKNDLPFVIIHMAAVAGSGAQPISVFNLILNTGEYKGLEKEIRKIVNYVNLFGYDLTTALRTVAATTPSHEFRELLGGIVATLETGGSLKEYLQSKADDALTSYKLEREKYVESISTYSDIYTSVLIAAPLLFLVTVAIINMLGGKIGSFESKDLAFFGTFIVLPFLNIGYIIFLNIIQPGE